MWLIMIALASFADASPIFSPADESSVPIEVLLSPVDVSGAPSDLLEEDRIVPLQERSTLKNRSEGAVHQEIAEAVGQPATDYGTPGGLSQFRGLSRSSSETDVHTLGVPLNLPHGVGFDFSVFPQFIWSGFRYRGVSASGTRDPRASGASIALIPWTYEALEEDRAQFSVSHLEASEGLRQSAVAASVEGAAIVAGYSDGTARGVSGSAGARKFSPSGKTRWLVHFLGTDLRADSPGPFNFPTPNATQRTLRAIPFIQMDKKLSASGLLKQSVFFDRNQYEYDDPDTAYQSRVDSSQWGADTVLRFGDWRSGVLYRQVGYESSDGSSVTVAPPEHVGRLELGRTFGQSPWVGDVSGSLTGVSRFGFHPGLGFGVRRNLDEGGNRGVYFRGRLDRRIPTLSDRFFDTSFFEANPDLVPEEVWSGVLGWESRATNWRSGIAFEAQWIADAMVLSEAAPFVWTVRNQGNAWRGALRGELEGPLVAGFDLKATGVLTRSRIFSTGLSYPYLPDLSATVGLERALGGLWRADLTMRLSGRSQDPSGVGAGLAGYAWMSAGAFGRALDWNRRGGGLDLGLRIENLLDRRIETVKNYLLPGRSFVVSATGSY